MSEQFFIQIEHFFFISDEIENSHLDIYYMKYFCICLVQRILAATLQLINQFIYFFSSSHKLLQRQMFIVILVGLEQEDIRRWRYVVNGLSTRWDGP